VRLGNTAASADESASFPPKPRGDVRGGPTYRYLAIAIVTTAVPRHAMSIRSGIGEA